MHSLVTRTLFSRSPDHSCALARRLGAYLRPGDVVLLSGDIGAGKTHFARCLIQSLLLHPEDVPSPTYTLVQTYPGKTGEIWHADLYRLSDVNEVFELGLTDAFDNAISLIEWPDRLGDLAPAAALDLTFTPGDSPESRMITMSWRQGDWEIRLKEALDD